MNECMLLEQVSKGLNEFTIPEHCLPSRAIINELFGNSGLRERTKSLDCGDRKLYVLKERGSIDRISRD
jgi:hypothetical protein